MLYWSTCAFISIYELGANRCVDTLKLYLVVRGLPKIPAQKQIFNSMFLFFAGNADLFFRATCLKRKSERKKRDCLAKEWTTESVSSRTKKTYVCPFMLDKMKMARPKTRIALGRCPTPRSEVIQRRLGNAWAAEKIMPTRNWTTPELLRERNQKRPNQSKPSLSLNGVSLVSTPEKAYISGHHGKDIDPNK